MSETVVKKTVNWNAWFIFSAILLPMAAAYIIFTTGYGMPTGTINKGSLVTPAVSIQQLSMTDLDGKQLSLQGEQPLWRMLLVSTENCTESCQHLLYLSRQVHIRLGEKARRVERLYLTVSDQKKIENPFESYLEKEHPKLKHYWVSGSTWNQFVTGTSLAESKVDGSTLYLVDQENFVMMAYDQSHSGADMLDDIKRLLKYSYEEK